MVFGAGRRRILPAIARILMGVAFCIFGLNGFLNFIPQPKAPMPEGAAAFQEYQSARIGSICNLLGKLSEDDLDDVQRLLAKLHDVVGSPSLS